MARLTGDERGRKPTVASTPGEGISTRIVTLTTAAILLIASVVSITVLAHHRPGNAAPRTVSTVSKNQRVCLLSDAAQPSSTKVFGFMQHAATDDGHINVQHITLPAQATDAAPQLAGLVQQQCTVIFTLGPLSTLAARNTAKNTTHRTTEIVAVTDGTFAIENLTTLPATGLTAAQVAEIINKIRY